MWAWDEIVSCMPIPDCALCFAAAPPRLGGRKSNADAQGMSEEQQVACPIRCCLLAVPFTHRGSPLVHLALHAMTAW